MQCNISQKENGGTSRIMMRWGRPNPEGSKVKDKEDTLIKLVVVVSF